MSARPGLAPSHERRVPRRHGAGRRDALPVLETARHDAAREAWRQFARAAGARRRGPSSNRSVPWVLLAALAAAVVFWLLRDSTVDPPRDETDAVVSSARPERAPLVAADEPEPQREIPQHEASAPWAKRVATDEGRPRPPTTLAAAERPPAEAPVSANPRLKPRGATQASDGWSGPKNPRTAPPGTHEANAEALRKLPVARADKPPLAGVGALGIHIDEISIGSLYDAGKCSGHDTGFSAQRNDRVSVCFRIVHPRTTQQVNVLWQKDGEVMRRTKMTIPSAHAYRTRAFIVLRDGDAGRWTVRVLSSDDVELAQARFVVQR